MLALLGLFLVLSAVFGGYILERGNPWVLFQPAELLIIGGSALGIILLSNPPSVIRKMARGIRTVAGPAPYTRASLLRTLRMMFEFFSYAQRAGVQKLEEHVEHPRDSSVFKRYPQFLADSQLLNFFCDTMRMLVIGSTTPQELDHLMDLDMEVQRRGRHEPVSALSAVADALPGLGIVAAVLGVVITMQAIGSTPESVGEKVAAALVGTFLGILLCYGLVGPVAARLEAMGETQAQMLQLLRTGIMAFARGCNPMLAVEYGRRSIPLELRPSFGEMETTIRRDAQVPAVPLPPGMEGHNEARTNAAS
jgi:chemotaxis protein MotA